MPSTPLRLSATAGGDELVSALAALPEELGLRREFPPSVLAEAAAAAARPLPELPDARDIDFVTIDPPGSTDLDQALHLERDGGGWICHYAIADLSSFVVAGGALDAEARRRGQTIYAPDGRIPLHPPVLSEGAASLLEGQDRAAYLWTLRLDAAGALIETHVARSLVRSRAQLDYASVQERIDGGAADGSLALLREVGEAREAQERARGGASLNTPETLVERDTGAEGNRYRLVRRSTLPVEGWNAQLSLLTGMAAADLMLAGRVGILRTMPPADPEAVERFRRQTAALGTAWPASQPYGEYLAGLDAADPGHLAILHAAASLFRGAGYTAFEGELPEQTTQAAIAAPYAHVTAPLRRLVDRAGLSVCAALSAGGRPDADTLAALPELPAIMASTGAVAGRVDRMAIDIVEAAVLRPRVGEEFDAVVISAKEKGGGTIQLLDPAVTASCTGPLVAGESVRVRLTRAEVSTGLVEFAAG